jgi:hypothetical protein
MRPMLLVFPKTPKECIVKKYAEERPLDIEDVPIIEELNANGLCIRISSSEKIEISGGRRRIWRLEKALSTRVGIGRLKLGSLD